ncbi:MAG: TetR/AcrR family transcriptional regulator [Betaproteobacteria bacterium]|nr:TetR/AcrR family transcriptional regulator [Betaproteobacteria bacterium]
MARTRSISDDALLDKALPVFWERGYAATSLRDLTQVTGLSSAALYHRFEDKDGIFVEVLRRYADQGLSPLLARLRACDNPLTAVRGFFDALLAMTNADPAHRGCLLVNTALDGAPISERARALVRERLNHVEAFFLMQLRRAQKSGQLDRGFDAAAYATVLLGTVLALRVLGRLDPDHTRLRRMVRQALAPLVTRRQTTSRRRSAQ